MTFLSPMAAVWGAAATLPVLLALYMLKLRRRPVTVSTILFWPRARRDVQVNVPLRLVRPSWLLALHLAVLACLLAAMARPVVSGGPAPGSRVVLVIDRSASMSARDLPGGPSRLDAARSAAREAARAITRSGGSAAVVGFAAEASAMTGFTSSRAALEDAIGSIEPTDQPADLGAALRLAASLAPSVEEPERPVEIVLIGDGAYEGEEATGFAGVPVRFVRVGPEPRGHPGANDGIVTLGARRDYADPATVRLFVEIASNRREAHAAGIAVSIDGVVITRRAVQVPAPIADEPARAGAAFEFSRAGGGVVAVALAGGDALSADDMAALVLPASARPGVLLVRPAGEPPVASVLLEDVLREMRFRSVRVMSVPEYEALGGRLEGIGLVIFDDAAGAPLPGVASITIGAGPTWPGLASDPAPEDGPGESPVIWLREHPVMRDVVLDSLVVSGAAELRVGQGVVELARGPRGAMLVLTEGPPRRIAVAFSLARSNWPLLTGFPIFLANAADYLALGGEASAGRMYTTAEPVLVAATRDGVLTLDGPRRLEVTPSGGVAAAGLVERAGVYVVRSGPDAIGTVAVNLLDAGETGLASPGSVRVGEREVASGPAGGGAPRELWSWAVLLAGVLLVVEWFVYGARARA